MSMHPTTLHRAATLATALLLTSLAGCTVMPSSSPPLIPPTADPTESLPADWQLLAALPTEIGGVQFDRVQIVDDSINVGLSVDDVFQALDKRRPDAVSVFRYTRGATIGATAVKGVTGETLLKAFVDAWNAPAVIERRRRPAAGSSGWELRARGGNLTVVYRAGNVVYLVSTQDASKLEEILAGMPPGGE